MRIEARWASGMRFEAVTPDALGIVMDAPHGGTAGGPTPMEALLMALAGCTGMDVIPILQKMRAPVDRFTIDVTAERADTHPKVLTAIHLRYAAAGPGLRREQVEKAVALSQEKYCSVSAMLRKAVPITYQTDVIDTGVAPLPAVS
ncbi:MAG TPA: OsmC family protein [bacterium]|nr:OsmC family protein [bacterium]